MRVIFMGTPDFAASSLARLIEDGYEIVAVFTQPDKPAGRGKHEKTPPVKELALRHGLRVYQPAKIKTNEEVRQIFESLAPDICVVAAYGKILPGWMLCLPRLGSVNVHASLLPKYRGAAPINWAIARGERETGVTIMQMDEGLDTGPMFTKRAVEIGPRETAVELTARLAELGAALLSETLPLIERGEIEPEPQNDGAATHAPMLKREDGLIDWSMSAEEISNRVRAFQPWPGAYTIFRGSRLIIWRARHAQSVVGGAEPGLILAIGKEGITVSCGTGTALLIEELQVEGKRRHSARDFANGMRLSPGDYLTGAGSA
jgi:methionyl-tRNA formyltransferase